MLGNESISGWADIPRSTNSFAKNMYPLWASWHSRGQSNSMKLNEMKKNEMQVTESVYVPKCIHFGWCAGIPGVISSAPTEITLSAVRLRRRRRLQEKLLDLILISLLITHQQSFKHLLCLGKKIRLQENLLNLDYYFSPHHSSNIC